MNASAAYHAQPREPARPASKIDRAAERAFTMYQECTYPEQPRRSWRFLSETERSIWLAVVAQAIVAWSSTEPVASGS